MPLTYLLYRCPRCGHDPMKGEKDRAACSKCGMTFFRGGQGGLIRVQGPSGEVWEVPGHRLTAAMRAHEDAGFPQAWGPGVTLRVAEVAMRRSGQEAPVQWAGRLLGFAEAMGEVVSGTLELTGESLIFRTYSVLRPPGNGISEDGAFVKSWPLLEIRAVQTSSSCLQFSPASGGLVELRFPKDSPFRWENLLRNTLREVYRREGIGEIVEFQPRIVVEGGGA